MSCYHAPMRCFCWNISDLFLDIISGGYILIPNNVYSIKFLFKSSDICPKFHFFISTHIGLYGAIVVVLNIPMLILN